MVSTIFNFIYLLSLVGWIGSIFFFSFFVAPAVFKTLDREKAGEMVGIIFPRYYKLGYICGIFILLSFLFSGAEEIGLKWCAWGIMVFGSGIAGLVINPKAKRIKEKLKFLHSLSVKLNAVVLFSGLWLLGLTAINFHL